MKKIVSSVLLIFVLSFNFIAIGSVVAQPSEKIDVIIRFNGKADGALIRAHGGDIKYEYDIISAIACSLPEQAIEALSKNPNIEKIEPDGTIYAITQTIDWGITRIGANIVHTTYGNTGEDIKVAIIDSGIDYYHPDLENNIEGGINLITAGELPIDDFGHGTHCAGIVAAEDNEIGVVGVAPDADLYIVKMLGDNGVGSESDLIEGIQWTVSKGVQIISMSLGSDGASSTLELACDAAEGFGVLLVAAAGNDYRVIGRRREVDTVDYPGRFDSVIAVGATDIYDNKASFSSTGPDVELVAPGVEIISTVPTYFGYPDDLGVGIGTSMACPHVAGVAALVFASPMDPSYDYDGDGIWDAVEVRAKLQDTADDKGAVGKDYWYGYGLVDAEEAALPTVPLPNQAPVADAGTTQNVQLDSDSKASVTFDGSGSYDPDLDGSIVTYDWEIDGTALTGIAPTYTFTTATTYTVILTVTDNEGATDSDEVSIIVEEYQVPPQETPIHVEEIVLAVVAKGGGRILYATSTITVTDDQWVPVEGVLVTGDWSYATSGSDSGLTDSIGKVTFKSDTLKKPEGEQTFTFKVQTLSKDGCIYISASNVETEDSITYPQFP